MERFKIQGFRKRRIGEDGQAMLEFAITFPWVMLMVLAIMQFALMYNAKSMVDFAAFSATRCATVFVPRYEWFTFFGFSTYGNAGEVDWFKKYLKIHVAAAVPLMPISPGITEVTQGWPGVGPYMALIRAIIESLPGPWYGIADGVDRFVYAYAAVSVNEFWPWFGCGISITQDVDWVNWGTGHTFFELPNNRGDICCRVRYYMFLSIPFINHFIAQWGPYLRGEPPNPPTALAGDYDTNFWAIESYCTMPYEGKARDKDDEPSQWLWLWP